MVGTTHSTKLMHSKPGPAETSPCRVRLTTHHMKTRLPELLSGSCCRAGPGAGSLLVVHHVADGEASQQAGARSKGCARARAHAGLLHRLLRVLRRVPTCRIWKCTTLDAPPSCCSHAQVQNWPAGLRQQGRPCHLAAAGSLHTAAVGSLHVTQALVSEMPSPSTL